MTISKILNSLENYWKRDDILLKIKNGSASDEIVNEFILNNEGQVKQLSSLLKPQDILFLNQVEQLSTCEAKLLNKINNLNNTTINETHDKFNEKKISLETKVPNNSISLFMINWSNKFVFIALLIISAVALSRQAWA